MDFAKPWLDNDMGQEAIENVLRRAALVWNLSMLPADQQKASLEDAVRQLSFGEPDRTARFLNEFESMLKRKRERYSEIRIGILGLEVSETPRGLHLDVACVGEE